MLIVRTYSTVVDGITLPFGDPAGDRIGPYQNDAVSPAITLSTMFPFYGRNEDTVYVSDVHVHACTGLQYIAYHCHNHDYEVCSYVCCLYCVYFEVIMHMYLG